MQSNPGAHRIGDAIEEGKIVAIASRGDHRTHQRFAGSTKSRLWHGTPFDVRSSKVREFAQLALLSRRMPQIAK
jgi:hypothetical protein